MTVCTALVFWLRGDPAVMALVDGHIYQNLLPQSPDYPAVVLTTVSEPEQYHLRGVAGVHMTRVQVDHYAQRSSGVDAKDQVDQVAAAVDARLSGRRFVQSASDGSAVFVQSCLRGNRIDTFEGAELNAFRVLFEYVIWSHPINAQSLVSA